VRRARPELLLVPLAAAALACAGGAAGPAAPSRPASPPAAVARPAPAGKPSAEAPAAPAPAAAATAATAPTTPGSAPAAAGSDLPPRTQRLFAEAVQAEQDLRKQKLPPDWPLLERRWRTVLEAGEVPEARYNLGVALEAQGRLDEARAEYERARAGRPGLRQAAVNLGVLREKAGDAAGAQALYAEVVRDFPEDARARERLATLYLSAGQLDEAWRLAREALLRDPRSVPANKVLIRVATERNQLDLAKLIALRTMKLDPADPELPLLAGELEAKAGDEAAAEAQLRKALSLDPHLQAARSALLRRALAKGRWAVVAEQAKALLEDQPRDAPVELVRGVALRHTDHPDEALAAYARAEELSGDKLAEVHLARGILLMRVKSQCEPALEEFRKYAQAAGPVAATESPVLRLQRECEASLDEGRKAQEAARALQQATEGKARPGAAKPVDAPVAPAVEGEGGAAPTPSPIEVP
jgi:tetratricopeptide (TPR) repeat protein